MVPGEVTVIPRGTTIGMHHEFGFPCIVGIFEGASITGAPETTPGNVTEVPGIGGDDGVYQTDKDGNARAPNSPVDVIGDDWIRRSRDGNQIGVLAGGVNVMKSGGMSQVRTNGLDELVEILSQRFRHVTGMGELNVLSENGKTSLVWRGGANLTAESGANRGHWSARLDVGATGDLFDFEITTPQGQSLARIHMSAEGRLSLTGVGGIDLTSGDRGTSEEVAAGNKNAEVGGDRTTTIAGTETISAGTRKVTLQNGDQTIVGGPSSRAISGDDLSLIMGNTKTRAYQNAIFDYLRGSVGIHLGNPALGGTPLAGKDFNVINASGGINLAVLNPGSRFTVLSNAPGSVMLGASGAAVYDPTTGLYLVTPVAPFGAVLFEPLAQLLGLMCGWIDGHLHLSAVGPTSPGAASPLGPISALIMPTVTGLRSQRVLIGA
jgi:hypothetical protein